MRARFLVFILSAAAMSANTWAKPTAKSACRPSELAQRDCHLLARGYNLQLLADTVAWTDGTWHLVDPVPLKGDGVVWEKVHFSFFGSHPILQFWIWDKGAGELQVQSLHWYVAEMKNPKMKILAEGVVRKRHPEQNGSTTSYLYDAWIPYHLKVLKGDRLEWTVGPVHKILTTDEVKHGI